MTQEVTSLEQQLQALKTRLENGWQRLEVEQYNGPDREYQIGLWLQLLKKYEQLENQLRGVVSELS